MKKHIFFVFTLMLLSVALSAQIPTANQTLTANEAFNKGMLYSFSGFVIIDMEKAKGFFKQALALGNTKANFELGKIYAKENKPESMALAVLYLEKAAQLGNSDAWTELGNLFYKTDLQYQDFAKSFNYFKKGADLGNNDCIAMLGYLLHKGLNKQQDYAKAFEYFEKAAQHDNPMALYFMGLQYRNGYGVERNIDLARTMLVKSAGFNHFQAIQELKASEPENPLIPITAPAVMQLNQTGLSTI
jgi:TPR repeat protein